MGPARLVLERVLPSAFAGTASTLSRLHNGGSMWWASVELHADLGRPGKVDQRFGFFEINNHSQANVTFTLETIYQAFQAGRGLINAWQHSFRSREF